ncbi:hypothetical protein ACFLV7_01815 [Chloroflexota bacterium]
MYFFVLPRPKIAAPTPIVNSTKTPIINDNYGENGTKFPTIALFISSPTPSNTAVPPTTTITPQAGLSPEEFIRSYYSLINQRQYQTTFAMLSDSFKDRLHCCNPDGSYKFGSYEEWWDSVSEVTIFSVDTQGWDNMTAKVVIRISYFMNDGRIVDSTHTFDLIADPLRKSWLIE